MISYHKDQFNCAHYAISEINKIHGLNIHFEDGDAWQAEFIPYLRSHFKPLNSPVNGCLVVMSQLVGGLHLGVYKDFHVWHNYNAGNSGCVIMSDMGTIRSHYHRVRFYAPNNSIQRD